MCGKQRALKHNSITARRAAWLFTVGSNVLARTNATLFTAWLFHASSGLLIRVSLGLFSGSLTFQTCTYTNFELVGPLMIRRTRMRDVDGNETSELRECAVCKMLYNIDEQRVNVGRIYWLWRWRSRRRVLRCRLRD